MTKLPRVFPDWRKRVKVEITCPCGTFIPGAYRAGRPASRYACDRCGFKLRLSTFRGEVDW